MKYDSMIEKYKNSIIKEYGDLTLILYGSTVYGVNTSDLDICYLSLRIDEEVPYDNKLVYSNKKIKETFSEPPFPYVENKFKINPIIKSKSYLSSLEMSKRLLLNILTVRHDIIFGDEAQVKQFSDKAWDVMIRIVLSYAERNEVTIDELINLLYEDPYSHATGELYLGYKDNLQEKMDFLEASVGASIIRLEEEQVAKKTLKKRYKFNESWIKNGTKN